MNRVHKKTCYLSIKLLLYSLLWINISSVVASAQPEMAPAKVAVDKIKVQTIEPVSDLILDVQVF